jgi:Ca2+-binding EF-hand superfamily protein
MNVYLFKGEKIDLNDLKRELKNMGIVLSDKELRRLLKNLPVDGKSCSMSPAT